MNKKPELPRSSGLLQVILAACLVFSLAACAAPADAPRSANVLEQAAATATALVQNANATALVMKARAEATALVAAADSGGGAASPPTPAPSPQPSFQSTSLPSPRPSPLPSLHAAAASPSPAAAAAAVEVVNVTTAADGSLLMVQYRAPARLAETWRQGNVAVIDEAGGSQYGEVPDAGPIGPLFSHPRADGKMAYFMLVNGPLPLKSGALVTVIMGDFKQEHVIIH